MDKLLETLNFSEDMLKKTKFKFNINEDDPDRTAINLLKNNFEGFKIMTAYRDTTSKNLNLDNISYVVSFARSEGDKTKFVFGGLYYVEMLPEKVEKGVGYRLYLDQDTNDLINNLTVSFDESIGRTYLRYYDSVKNHIESVDIKNN